MDIKLSSDALDVCFHPNESSNQIVVGLISGKVQLYDYTDMLENVISDEPGKSKAYKRLWSVRPSHKSCRGVAFDASGSNIFCIFKDKSIIALDPSNGHVKARWSNAHESAPSRILSINESLLATGDDDGVVRLWNPNDVPNKDAKPKPILSYEHHSDWITDMLWCAHLDAPRTKTKDMDEGAKRKRNSDGERSRLVVTSGDGTLSVIDVHGGKKGVEVSEDQEDELLSIAPIKDGKKLVVGTQLGILSLWAPDRGMLDHVDRFPGHPSSVDAMCTLDHDTVLTGSSDGLIRVIQLFPHKLLGIVGDHNGMPIECIVRKGALVASIGHGNECKLTNLAPLFEEGDIEPDDDDADPEVMLASENAEPISRSVDASDNSSSEAEAPFAKRRDVKSTPLSKSDKEPDGHASFFADLQ